MSSRVSVIVPCLNEEASIRDSILSARDAGAFEVIVCDGGSSDQTLSIAQELGTTIIDTEQMRARQMNAGARSATGEIVTFLHADTCLPSGACNAIENAVDGGAVFGGFHLRFKEKDPRLTVVAFMINARTRRTLCPWGDQAQFFDRQTFLDSGGFKEISIMEDYEIARRMKKTRRPALIDLEVATSGRRFLELGVVATTATNWKVIIAYHLGVPESELRAMYGGR